MPTRIIRDGMLTSERIDALTSSAELFYRRLMSVVDDHGRFYAHPKILRSATFPLKDSDQVPQTCVAGWLDECEAVNLIVRYEVKGTKYLFLVDFGQRIQGKSKFPNPPCSESTVNHGESPESTAQGVVEGVVEDEVVGEGGTQRRRKRRAPAYPIPPNFVISERVKKWAAEKGHGRLVERFDNFVSKAKAKGYEYADWDEAFMGAIREDWAKLGKDSPYVPGGGRKELGVS